MKLKAKDPAKKSHDCLSTRRKVERRKGVFRAGAPIAGVTNQRLKTLRFSERFRLWLRVVLPPDELHRFERWALDDEEGFSQFIRRYFEISSRKSSGKNGCEQGYEKLVNDIYETLLKIEDLSFDYSFDDWASPQKNARQKEVEKK